MDEAIEFFDLYDAQARPLGRAKPRAEVHRDGDWHRSAHVWIVTPEGALLFQRRAADKDTWPGRLDASVGGHYRAGETPAAAVVREVGEELGLHIAAGDLIALGPRRVESRAAGVLDRELQDIYLLPAGADLTVYNPDPLEVDGLVLLPAATAARLHAGTLSEAVAVGLPRGQTAPTPLVVRFSDLIPGRAAYLAALTLAVGDLLAGRAPRPFAAQPALEPE